MRLEEVRKALQFVKSEQLAGVPLSQQIQFLEQKGLTAEEISSVFSQITSSGLGAAITASAPTKSWIASITESAAPVAAMAVVGAAAYFLANRVLPDPPPVSPLEVIDKEEEEEKIPDLEEISPVPGDGVDSPDSTEPPETLEAMLARALDMLDQQNASMQQVSKDTEAARQNLRDQTEGLRKEVTAIREALAVMVPAMTPSIGEDAAAKVLLQLSPAKQEEPPAHMSTPNMKGDSAVNKLIESLRSQRQAESSGTSDGTMSPLDSGAASPSLQTEGKQEIVDESEIEIDVVAVQEAASRQLQEALAGVMAANKPEILTASFGQLKMYLNNIVSQPDNVRYRRIYTGNPTFKNSLGAAESHQLLLEACGFAKKGTNYEWAWSADRNSRQLWPVRLDTLKAAVRMLQDPETAAPTDVSERADCVKIVASHNRDSASDALSLQPPQPFPISP